MYVVEGDLTEYKVDAIVNAANESLEHVGGIAKAIVDKGEYHFFRYLNNVSAEFESKLQSNIYLIPGLIHTR